MILPRRARISICIAMAEPSHDADPFRTGLSCRCPRCAAAPIFRGPLTLVLRDRCPNCGLSYSFVDSGDGPAVFVMTILGFVVLGAALVVEFKLAPPLWLHFVLWAPLILVLSLALLRPMKATLIALQWKHKAEEGRLTLDQR